MNKALSIALLAAGVVITVFGVQALDSKSSTISRFFTGDPTDKAMEMLTIGIVLGVIGLVGLLIPRRDLKG